MCAIIAVAQRSCPMWFFSLFQCGNNACLLQEDLGTTWNIHMKNQARNLLVYKLTWKYLQSSSVNLFKTRLLAILLGIMIVEPEP